MTDSAAARAAAKHVLVVEDEAVSALALQCALERAGHRVVAVVDRGEDALRRVAGERVDVALMDVRLKGEMNGLEAARRLRDDHGIPSIFLTAYGVDEFHRLHHDPPQPLLLLMKPVMDDELRRALAQVFGPA